jgi:hypothetical protein
MIEAVTDMKWVTATETRVIAAMRGRSSAMSAQEIASLIGCEFKAAVTLLEAMYWASKIEKKQGNPTVYRIPGGTDGKLSLPN